MVWTLSILMQCAGLGRTMADSTTFNPDMLRLARDARELTQVKLATRSGVTQAFISKLEHGLHVQPGDDAMQRMADVLGFPVDFFMQHEKALGFPHFHYRKQARLGAKPLARIGAIINIRRIHITKLLRSYEIDVPKPIPQIDLDEQGITPEKAAERLRAYWMVPRGPIVNLVELIENAGGIVILTDFRTNLLDGLSFRVVGLPPLFFMNKNVSGDRFRFSLAHELGHMVMHLLPADDDKLEDEAHRFAAAFLTPANEIRPYLINAKLSTLGRVKSYWKVSIKSLIFRAHELKIITDFQYLNLNIQYSKSVRGEEPVVIEIEKPCILQRIVRYHFDVLGYSVEELAKLLAIHPCDFEKAYLPTRPSPRLIVSN